MLNPTAILMLLVMAAIVVYCATRVVESARNGRDGVVVRDDESETS